MNIIRFLLVFAVIAHESVPFESETGTPFEMPPLAAFVVLDGRSCALCNKRVAEFVESELQGCPVYALIDSKQPRSMRFIDMERHAAVCEALQMEALFPTAEIHSVKSYFNCPYAKTPFVAVVSVEDTVVFDYSWFEGNESFQGPLFDRMHELLDNYRKSE